MFTDTIASAVIPAVRAGRYSLLLGAGFSCSSTGPDGRNLPLGGPLRDEVAAHFGLPNSYPLTRLTGAVPPDDLDQFLRRRMFGCHASAAAARIRSFLWSGIFSLNVDDVLQDVYRIKGSQEATFLTLRDPYQQREDIGEVQIVQLHGSVRQPDHGYVFSAQAYAEAAASDFSWFKILVDLLQSRPFILLGCSFDEPDIEYYLARRAGLSASSGSVAPSIFVNPAEDAVLRSTCERLGLVHVTRDSDSFLAELDRLSGDRPSASDLLLTTDRRSMFTRPIDERGARIFFRQWTTVKEDELPIAAEELHLLAGVQPRWAHVVANQDVVRADTTSLVSEINTWVSNPARESGATLLLSAAGEGKTCLMLRTALEVSRIGITPFYFSAPDERMVTEDAARILRSLGRPVVLFIDDCAEHAYETADLLAQLTTESVPYFAVLAVRPQRLPHLQNAFGAATWTEKGLRSLSLGESTELARRLRSAGFMAGRGLTDAQVAARMQQSQLIAAIVTAGGSVARFRDIIARESRGIANSDAARVYRTIAIAHYCGSIVRAPIVARAANVTSARLWELLRTELRGMVYVGPDGESCTTRHRVVAEMVLANEEPEKLEQAAIYLAKALSHWVSRPSIMRRTPEARLGGRLLDYDEMLQPLLRERSRAFYLALEESWGWNSRYWEQRALLELDTSPMIAVDHSETAVRIEEHPHTLTTLAKVCFRIAERSAGAQQGEEFLQRGIDAADRAIALSARRRRLEPHAFDVGVRGLASYFRESVARGYAARIQPRWVSKGHDYLAEARPTLPVWQLKRLETEYRNACPF